jgi:hypothetical protein
MLDLPVGRRASPRLPPIVVLRMRSRSSGEERKAGGCCLTRPDCSARRGPSAYSNRFEHPAHLIRNVCFSVYRIAHHESGAAGPPSGAHSLRRLALLETHPLLKAGGRRGRCAEVVKPRRNPTSPSLDAFSLVWYRLLPESREGYFYRRCSRSETLRRHSISMVVRLVSGTEFATTCSPRRDRKS